MKMKGVIGVINNIICLYADIKIAEVIDVLARNIFDEIKQTHPGIIISRPAEDIDKAEHTMSEIESRLSQILIDKEWTWDKILADAKETCGSPYGTSVSNIGLRPEKLAQHFQVSYFLFLKP